MNQEIKITIKSPELDIKLQRKSITTSDSDSPLKMVAPSSTESTKAERNSSELESTRETMAPNSTTSTKAERSRSDLASHKTMAPTSAASTKVERNRRKRANIKKRTVAECQKKAAELELLTQMSTMSLKEKSLTTSHRDDSHSQLHSSSNGSCSTSSISLKKGIKKGKPGNLPDGHASRFWEIKPSPGKGLGIFATQIIRQGVVVFQEAPLISSGPEWLEKEAAFMLLSQEKKLDYMSLHSSCQCQQSPCNETPFMKIFMANNFEVRNTGNLVIFKVASRFNHACIPNAFRRFTEAGNIVIYAIADIKKGEEITLDYVCAGAVSVSVRRKYLSEKFGFICRCKGCVSNKTLSQFAVNKGKKDISTPVEVTNSEILGEQSAEEVAALAEIGPWMQSLKSFNDHMLDALSQACLVDHVRGVERREMLYSTYEDAFRKWLRENNKFGLSEQIIQHYTAMVKPIIVPKMEDYVRRLQEHDAEKSPNPSSMA